MMAVEEEEEEEDYERMNVLCSADGDMSLLEDYALLSCPAFFL